MRLTLVAYLTSMALASNVALAQTKDEAGNTLKVANQNEISPARNLQRRQVQRIPTNEFDLRTIDGSNNNLNDNEMGSAHVHLGRMGAAQYSDGISSPGGEGRPSAREVSNAIFAQSGDILNRRRASDFLWQWGQFLDHDIGLTEGANPAEAANITVPTGDIHFDPASTGTAYISLNRSIFDEETGSSRANPRQQINEISTWIDASNVYGSDTERAEALRTMDGTGLLKTSAGNMMPFNTYGLANASGNEPNGANLFLGGDVRANEQVGLAAMHTLFVREHNRLAEKIAEADPSLSGEEIYQKARQIVSGQMQAITYNEFLPVLLGRNALEPYRGYNANINVSLINEFSTAAYRLGHSLLSPQLMRVDSRGNEIPEGHLPLRDAFFQPTLLIETGLEPVLRGLATQRAQELDAKVIDDVRNFLFGRPGSGGFDLVSLNIQRGRDHGLLSYNQARVAMGMPAARDFSDITRDPETRAALASVYESVDQIDLWAGGLAEDKYRTAMVGELFFRIMKMQFEMLRDGDRFWYERSMGPRDIREVKRSRLSNIIRRNTTITTELRRNVFVVRR